MESKLNMVSANQRDVFVGDSGEQCDLFLWQEVDPAGVTDCDYLSNELSCSTCTDGCSGAGCSNDYKNGLSLL